MDPGAGIGVTIVRNRVDTFGTSRGTNSQVGIVGLFYRMRRWA
jgi:hypothetical protein